MVEVTVAGKNVLINPEAVAYAEASEHFTNRTRVFFSGGLFAEIDVAWEDFPAWLQAARSQGGKPAAPRTPGKTAKGSAGAKAGAKGKPAKKPVAEETAAPAA